jgi:hypothetical protein
MPLSATPSAVIARSVARPIASAHLLQPLGCRPSDVGYVHGHVNKTMSATTAKHSDTPKTGTDIVPTNALSNLGGRR